MNNQEEIRNNLTNSSLKDFQQILNRSSKISKIQIIDNPIKNLIYQYTRDEEYPDEVIAYLIRLKDKNNQDKNKRYISDIQHKSNFQMSNLVLDTNIDIPNEYESLKMKIYSNPKAYNVHEHRKIPYENEVRHGHRRNYFHKNEIHNIKHNNNRHINTNHQNKRSYSSSEDRNFHYDKNQKRSKSYDVFDKNNMKHNNKRRNNK